MKMSPIVWCHINMQLRGQDPQALVKVTVALKRSQMCHVGTVSTDQLSLTGLRVQLEYSAEVETAWR